MELLFGENCIILSPTSTVLTHHPCDRHTDGRTIAYSALSIICYSIMLSRTENRWETGL